MTSSCVLSSGISAAPNANFALVIELFPIGSNPHPKLVPPWNTLLADTRRLALPPGQKWEECVLNHVSWLYAPQIPESWTLRRTSRPGERCRAKRLRSHRRAENISPVCGWAIYFLRNLDWSLRSDFASSTWHVLSCLGWMKENSKPSILMGSYTSNLLMCPRWGVGHYLFRAKSGRIRQP